VTDQTLPPSPPPGRLPGIEGLRAVAASAVLLHHIWLYGSDRTLGQSSGLDAVFLNLALGVTLFFALSGFLLYRPFAAAIARRTTGPDIRGYLRNRILRIAPAYWVILLVTALVLRTALTRDAHGELVAGALTDPVDLLRAALLIQDYDPDTLVIGVGPAWSLAVEAVFYLLLPVLVLAAGAVAARYERRSRRVLILLAPPLFLLLLGLSGKLVAGVAVPGGPGGGYASDWHSVIERSFWCQADLFSFGMVAAVLHTEFTDGRLALPSWWRAAALVLAPVIALPAADAMNAGQLGHRPENTAVALAAGLVLAAVTFPVESGRPPLIRRGLERRAVVAVGLISYSVFLWNEPVIRWLNEHGATREGWSGLVWNVVLCSALVGVLSVLTYRLVELPALKRKRRRPVAPEQLEAAP
jgi:peptidoglycan/LPS O-acetylase OafA/YrhL